MLELPSENWHEYLDNWCCHGNEAITKLKDGLNPREGDCLLGDWYILLHPEVVNTQNVDVMKVVICATVSKTFVVTSGEASPTHYSCCVHLSMLMSVKTINF